MKPRFQADADLNLAIVHGTMRREPAIDFETAVAAGLRGLDDPEVLRTGARSGRVLVSHDGKTMPLHFARFVETETSAGVIILPQHLPIAVAIEELVEAWRETRAEDWVNRICWLPK